MLPVYLSRLYARRILDTRCSSEEDGCQPLGQSFTMRSVLIGSPVAPVLGVNARVVAHQLDASQMTPGRASANAGTGKLGQPCGQSPLTEFR
jgi:hypothetical protein